jgi:nucleotide-binding universal stress UspA family protein
MATLTICAGLSGSRHLHQTVHNWSAAGLPQILAGESDLPPEALRTLWPEIATTAGDAPRLDELLRYAERHASSDWLLLIGSDTLLSRALLDNLSQLCRPGSPRRLVIGRAWREHADARSNASTAQDPDSLWDRIESEGVLDSPEQIGWVLLPRGALLAAPPELSSEPAKAAPWLIRCAQQLGWPVLDATAAAPALRLGGPVPAVEPMPQPTAVVRPHQPAAPLLSLLLAAPEAELERLQAQLLPAASLPWEVIARPAEPADGVGGVAAAWTSGLAVARGELAWPITEAALPLALLPVVLRSFEQPGQELLQLGPTPGPGALVAPTTWWRLLGAWRDDLPPAEAMAAALQQALARGACLRQLPFRPAPAARAGAAAVPGR